MAEQVRTSINAALTAGKVEEKVAHLNAAKEIVIHRRNELEQDEILELIAELCSPALQLDAEQKVRHFVLLFIEELSRAYGVTIHMLLKPMEALALMLEDENQPEQIARWALTSAAKSWKCVLYVLANQVKDAGASQLLKSLLWRLKAAAVYTLERRKDRGSRLNAVKFLEVIAMTFYNEPSGQKKRRDPSTISAPAAPQFESLRDARLFSHPSLPKAADLNREGEGVIQTLINALLNESQPSAVRLACSTSLVLIARLRPDAREIVVDALVTLVVERPHQDIALLQAVKTNSVLFLKSAVPDEKSLEGNTLYPKLTQVLRSLKADEHIARHIEPLKRRKHLLDQEQAEIQRRMRDYPPQKNKFPTEGLHLLPIETLARLLVENAGNVPREPPPGHRIRGPKETHVMLGPTGLPPKLERVMLLFRAVETGRGILNLPKPLQDMRAPELNPSDALKQREQAFERICTASYDAMKLGFRSRGYGWSEQSYETAAMAAARVACDVDVETLEEGAAESADLRNKLVDGLLSMDDVGKLLAKNEHGQVVLDDEVAVLSALHVEFAAERTRQEISAEHARYEPFLNAIVSKLLTDPLRNSRRLSIILRDAPAVPESTLHLVLEQCEVFASHKAYFSLIRELVSMRPTLRPVLLDVLLNYTTRTEIGPSAARRDNAIKLIANKIYKAIGEKWSEHIRNFAVASINSLTLTLDIVPDIVTEARRTFHRLIQSAPENPPVDNGPKVAWGGLTVEEEKAKILSRIMFCIALCAIDADLLKELFKAYSAIRDDIAKTLPVLLSNVESGSGDEIRIQQRATRIVDTFHAETDLLWRRLAELHPVQKTFGFLQDLIPGAEELALRACGIFAKTDPDASVIPLCSIRREGSTEALVEEDVRFFIPIIGSLGKDEAFNAIQRIAVSTEIGKVKEEVKRALDNIINGTLGRTLEASDLLVFIATMDYNNNPAIAIHTTDAFLEKRNLWNDKVMRKAFEELCELDQLPLVLMRIAIYVNQAMPILKSDVLKVCQRVAEREVWNDANLWPGFRLLVPKLLPDSFELILRLPEDIFKRFVTEVEAGSQQKNFKDLMRNLAKNNPQLIESLSKAQGEAEAGMDVEEGGEAREVASRPILSAFAKEYLSI